MMPRWRGELIFRRIRARATAEKSSKLWMCGAFTAGLGEPERYGSREVLVSEKERFREVARGRQRCRAEPWCLHLGPLPRASFQGKRRDAAAHVIERLEEHAVTRALDSGQRNALARLEEHLEPVRSPPEGVARGRDPNARPLPPAPHPPLTPHRA